MDENIMKMIKAKGQPIQGDEKESKMEVLKELVRHMYDIIGGDVDDMMQPKDAQEVVVSAENPEDLKKGLNVAQDVVGMAKDMSSVHGDIDLEDEEDEDIY